MKVKRLVAKAMVGGVLGLPAAGLGVGVADAELPSPPPVPGCQTQPGGCQAPDAAAQTGVATATMNLNKVVPTTTATPFTSTGAAAAQTGVATATMNLNKVVPTTTATPFTSTGAAAAQTGVATATMNGNKVGPTTRATRFVGVSGRSTKGDGLNRRGVVSRQLRLFGPLRGLLQLKAAEAAGSALVRTRRLRSATVCPAASVVGNLRAMGYAGRESLLEDTGKPGDSGPDGVVRQDALGLDLVGVQAKRYDKDSSVQRPDIQAFMGALHGAQTSRGVLVTTGKFSAGAKQFAENVGMQPRSGLRSRRTAAWRAATARQSTSMYTSRAVAPRWGL